MNPLESPLIDLIRSHLDKDLVVHLPYDHETPGAALLHRGSVVALSTTADSADGAFGVTVGSLKWIIRNKPPTRRLWPRVSGS